MRKALATYFIVGMTVVGFAIGKANETRPEAVQNLCLGSFALAVVIWPVVAGALIQKQLASDRPPEREAN